MVAKIEFCLPQLYSSFQCSIPRGFRTKVELSKDTTIQHSLKPRKSYQMTVYFMYESCGLYWSEVVSTKTSGDDRVGYILPLLMLRTSMRTSSIAMYKTLGVLDLASL